MDELDEAVEWLDEIAPGDAKEAAQKLKKLREESSRNKVFEKCLCRALDIYKKENPNSEDWPDGAKNIAWALGKYDKLLDKYDDIYQLLWETLGFVDGRNESLYDRISKMFE